MTAATQDLKAKMAAAMNAVARVWYSVTLVMTEDGLVIVALMLDFYGHKHIFVWPNSPEDV